MITLPCLSTLTSQACRVHGEHLSTCRGIQLDGRRPTACTGCLPQPATRGLLCESCFERLHAALDVAEDLITHMRSVERGPQPVGPKVHTKPGPRVIIPASWLEADATWEALHDLAFRCDPLGYLDVRPGGTTAYGFGSRDSIEHVRDRVALAVDLVRAADVHLNDQTALLGIAFYRRAQTALHRYPLAEQARAVAYARCRECGHMTLERRPPLEYLDPITVRCTNPACGAVFDPAIVEVDLAAFRAEVEAGLAS